MSNRQFFGQNLQMQNNEELIKLKGPVAQPGEQLEFQFSSEDTIIGIWQLKPYPYFIFQYADGFYNIKTTPSRKAQPINRERFHNVTDAKIAIRHHFNKGQS